MKIVSKGKSLQSPAFIEKKKRQRRIAVTTLAVSILVALIILVFVSRLAKLQVKIIEVEGNTITKNEEIAEVIRAELEKKYFGLLPKSNSLIYPKGRIVEALEQQIPRLKEITIERIDGTNGLQVTVSERDEYALYCKEVTLEFLAQDCYFLDDDGYIYSKAPLFSGQVYFIYKMEPPIVEPLGKNLLDGEEFYKLKRFIEEGKKLGVMTNTLLITSGEYTLSTNSGGKVIWKREDQMEKIFGNLESFLLDTVVQSDKTFFDRLLYIDLRYQNKVFYKFKS